MFTQEEYLWAWLFYLVGAGLFLLFWWRVTANIKWRETKYLLRVFVTIFLLVPWHTEKNGEFLSPAWIISILEGAFDGVDAFWRAGTPLLTALFAGVVLSSIVYIGFWLWAKKLR